MKFNFKIIILSQLVLFSALFFYIGNIEAATTCESLGEGWEDGPLCNTTCGDFNDEYAISCYCALKSGPDKCCMKYLGQLGDYEYACIDNEGNTFMSSDRTRVELDFSSPDPDVIFKPSVTIPGSIKIGDKNFTLKKGEGIKVDGLLIAKYLGILFRWLVSVVGIVAVLFIAFAGLQWISAAGNAEVINKAKKTMKDSLIGVLLAVASYAMLYNINPSLVNFGSLSVPKIIPLPLEIVGDTAMSFTPNCTPPASKLTGNEAFTAAQSQASELTGKTSYILGAKAGSPCYNHSNVDFCLDCSGFISYIYYCGASQKVPAGTANLFSDSGQLIYLNNRSDLQPGDILGWKAGDGGKEFGHVGFYDGSSVIHTAGPSVEKSSDYENRAIRVESLDDFLAKYEEDNDIPITYARFKFME